MKRAVIFDMDGVLVDSNEAHLAAFTKVGEEIGVPFPPGFMRKIFGMHNNAIFPLWLGETDPETVRQLSDRKEAIYREIATTRLREIPGAMALVRELHAEGFRLAVGSSGPRLNVALAIATLGAAPYFDALVSGDDVQHGKPDPEIFLKAAAALELPPRICTVIEDAPPGIEAALTAGMKVVAITSSRPAVDLKRATLIIDAFRDLSPAKILSL